MKRFLALCLVSAAAQGSPAPVPLRISRTYTNVQFSIYKFGVLKQEGTFRESSGEILLDPADPTRSRVNLTVEVSSIDTRNGGRDSVLKSGDFFDAGRYPAMTFASASIARTAGSDTFQVTGDLTIRGVTRRITVPVTFFGLGSLPGAGTFAGFETDFTVDRTAFGVNGTRWSGGKLLLSREVKIHLTVGAVKESCREASQQPCQ